MNHHKRDIAGHTLHPETLMMGFGYDPALSEDSAGTQAYTAVITAQNTLLSAQQTALGIAQSRLTDAVALIQALGGGWKV